MLFTKQKLKEIQNHSQIIPPDYFLIGTHTSEKVEIIYNTQLMGGFF